MAHRKLQQEIDRVFKKINEGLEIFDMYYERHESCVNNPSQKDKLEADLKREVKKLQRLREQIKSWQSSPEVKDKDSLLNYRRSVEIAMEKYKAVEKASKEKAYSNISLKRSDVLDPQEKERREVEDFLSQQIEDLERQFDLLQIEVDKLIVLQKKKKTASLENEKQLESYKELQGRYRYHQQQMELALRLIANEELEPQQVRDIEDEILFYVEENQSEGFVEDDSIYEGLNLQSNEAIAHEVAAAFASRAAGDAAGIEFEIKDPSKLSKKELRRLEREAKKTAKVVTKPFSTDENITPVITGGKSLDSVTLEEDDEEEKEQDQLPETQTPPSSKSISPTPPIFSNMPQTGIPSTAMTTAPSNPQTPLLKSASISSTKIHNSSTPEIQGFTHIHQSLNGLTTTTLKPAPVKPISENKWALATEKKLASLKAKNVASTPPTTKTPLSVSGISNNVSQFNSSFKLSKTMQDGSSIVDTHDSINFGSNNKYESKSDFTNNNNQPDLIVDDYESVSTDDELDEEPTPEIIPADEYSTKHSLKEKIQESLLDNVELLTLPAGIKDFIIGSIICENKLYQNDGKHGGYRRLYDICQPCRFNDIPTGVLPPQPLDVTRCIQQWDQVLLSLDLEKLDQETIVQEFQRLETFTLFYQYYFSITPLEQKICSILLKQRDWKVLKTGDCWFLRQGNAKFSNELCEIGDYKIFKMDIWTVVDKINFKLDYSLLAEHDNQKNGDQKENSISANGSAASFGKQLLQTLRQGKAE